MKKTILAIVAVAALAACRGPTEPDTRWARPETTQFATSLNVDLSQMTRTASGLYVLDLEVGEGRAAAAGDSLRVHYTGWLPDGTVFDNSHERNIPIKFQLGVGLMIRGWDEGLIGMQPGGRRKLVVRPELGYGRLRNGPIPPLSTLVFEVQVIDVW